MLGNVLQGRCCCCCCSRTDGRTDGAAVTMAQAKIQAKTSDAPRGQFSRTLSMADRSGRLLESLDELEMRYASDQARATCASAESLLEISESRLKKSRQQAASERAGQTARRRRNPVVFPNRRQNQRHLCGYKKMCVVVMCGLCLRQGGGFTRSSIGHGAGKGVHPGNDPVHTEQSRNAEHLCW